MQSGDLYRLGETMGELRAQGARLVFIGELTLQEVRQARAEAEERDRKRPLPVDVPRWDILIKQALQWLLPGVVLWVTGSIDKALAVLQALK